MYNLNTIYSMADKIRKGSDLYQEALIWMGYRYAIGLTEGIRMQADQGIEQYKLFREIEYDTPEFHALASEISEYLKRKKIKDVIDLRNRLLESDLIWYSTHYGIHRHSTAATHCHDIVQYSQNVLSPQRKEFMAHDIRRELSQILHVGLNFEIPYGLQDEHDPIDYLMKFLQQNQIFTNEQLKEYKEIEVIKQSDGTITFYSEKATDKNMYHMDVFSLSFYDYFGWTDLASYFDTKSHKRCKTCYKGEEKIIEYFDSWTPDNYSETKLSFYKVKRPIDCYEKRPYSCTYIAEEYIIEDGI